ncbi:hypothetical protein [Neobacillus dielmonensis]|uniref:hypothetical protein n=1 Tax=Neobacillus dielmonensis TaxID=1347369 RepID=UPI0005A6A7D7|nr:hypothetical protein [Neobacillus dielmonensis]
MKKNRYLLCLLLSGFLLYLAVPRLSVAAEGMQGVFSLSWLAFALIVVAGNLTALLYSPKQKNQKPRTEKLRKRARSLH